MKRILTAAFCPFSQENRLCVSHVWQAPFIFRKKKASRACGMSFGGEEMQAGAVSAFDEALAAVGIKAKPLISTFFFIAEAEMMDDFEAAKHSAGSDPGTGGSRAVYEELFARAVWGIRIR